jgi:CopG family nickel-responsive transcriptional regulator
VVMHGKSDRLKLIADRMLAMRGVKHGGIEIIPGVAAPERSHHHHDAAEHEHSHGQAHDHDHDHGHDQAPAPRPRRTRTPGR